MERSMITIEVTEADIREAEHRDYCGAIEKAAERFFGTTVYVGIASRVDGCAVSQYPILRTDLCAGGNRFWELPAAAAAFQRDWNAGNEVRPFTFSVA
jgi:hypothetical protein